MIKISIFASAIRPWLWNDFFKSLESTTEEYEVVFAGPKNMKNIKYEGLKGISLDNGELQHEEPICKNIEYADIKWPKNFTYIQTANIKPAQCYQVALNYCKGETISWVADDCEFSDNLYNNAYLYWKSLKQDKAALSIQTIEDGIKYNMHDHSFIGFSRTTPLMAPVVLMSRQVCIDTGGFDRRFVAGQYENAKIMDLYEVGGCVLIFKDGEVYIDHIKKHKNEHSFRAGYTKDRAVLESIWGKAGTGRLLEHEPYKEKDLLVKSQSNNNPAIWS